MGARLTLTNNHQPLCSTMSSPDSPAAIAPEEFSDSGQHPQTALPLLQQPQGGVENLGAGEGGGGNDDLASQRVAPWCFSEGHFLQC